MRTLSGELPMWDVVSVTDLSRAVETWSLGTLATGQRVSKLSGSPAHWSGPGDALSPLTWDTWAVLSLPLPPDIPLQCLRHQVNGLMVSPAWRLSHAPPIPPVNNFNQIHYPDKSVINCHILHIIFPEFVKESQTMSPSEKQLWFSPEPRDGGTVCHNEAPLPRPPSVPRLGPDWQTFVVAASDHNKCKNSFDHSSHFTGVTQWPPPTSPLVTPGQGEASGVRRNKTKDIVREGLQPQPWSQRDGARGGRGGERLAT